MRIIVVLAWVLGSSIALGALTGAPAALAAPERYCERTLEDFHRLAYEENSRIGFSNNGGLFNSGVCWWHTRLQRFAIYLTAFAPEKPKPTYLQASQLIERLTSGNAVEIPGYENFRDFSKDFAQLIQSKLNSWQITDGGFKFHWIAGASRALERDPRDFARSMDYLYRQVHEWRQPQFVMLQLPGIVSHAWLLIEMERISDGYRVTYIDSNTPLKTLTWEYHYGDRTTYVMGEHAGVHEMFGHEFTMIQDAFRRACGRELR